MINVRVRPALKPIYDDVFFAGAQAIDGLACAIANTPSALIELEALQDAQFDERDALAFRKLRGDTLTLDEEGRLASLNRVLEWILPKPEPLPPDVVAAMAEAHRLVDV